MKQVLVSMKGSERVRIHVSLMGGLLRTRKATGEFRSGDTLCGHWATKFGNETAKFLGMVHGDTTLLQLLVRDTHKGGRGFLFQIK